MNGDVTDQNEDTPVIELFKEDIEEVSPRVTIFANKNVEETNQQSDRSKVTIL